MDVYNKLKALSLELPEPIMRPVNWLVEPFKIYGDLLFISGHGPRKLDKVIFDGRLGESMTIAEGRVAAKLCMLNLLATTELAIGDLNRINQVIKVLGFVKCTNDFHFQPEVIDGASELLIDLFGEKGKHARTAIGAYDLPRGISVEVEMIVSFS
jgi:enamine deaminase RidA (YjgF/YER057c/UK114 family)